MRYLAIWFICIGSIFAEQWIDSQYLLWFIRENPLASPLLTTGSYADALPGAIEQPNTHVVLGECNVGMGWINGFRIEVGSDIGYESGIEGSYFLLPTISKKHSFFTSGQPGSPNYAIPIFDVVYAG